MDFNKLISQDNFAIKGEKNKYTSFSKDVCVDFAQKIQKGEFTSAKDFFDSLGKKRASFARKSGDFFNALEFGFWRSFSGNPSDRFMTRLDEKYAKTIQEIYEKNPNLANNHKTKIDIKNKELEYSTIEIGEYYSDNKFSPKISDKLQEYPIKNINPQRSETYGFIRHSYKPDSLEHSWAEIEKIFEKTFSKKAKKQTEKQTKKQLGKMMWHYYQLMPYMRGSASIGDWAINCFLASKNIKPQKLEFGTNLDIQAMITSTPDRFAKSFANDEYCAQTKAGEKTNLNEYLKNKGDLKEYINYKSEFLKEKDEIKKTNSALKQAPDYDSSLLLVNIRANKMIKELEGTPKDVKSCTKEFLFLNILTKEIKSSFGISHNHSICASNNLVRDVIENKSADKNLYKNGLDGLIKNFYRAKNKNYLDVSRELAEKSPLWKDFYNTVKEQFSKNNITKQKQTSR